MPYFQCPRCGGTDSYGQWEQRFTSQNITYRDNQNRQVGNSNGGFGVTNVRQQYCKSCVSVKMDMKFTQRDFKILGIVALVAIGVPMIISLVTYLAVSVGSLTSRVNSQSLANVFSGQDLAYYISSAAVFLVGSVGVAIYRKVWIKKEDKKFLNDRFYRPRPPRSKKFLFSWLTLIFIGLNALYLFTVT